MLIATWINTDTECDHCCRELLYDDEALYDPDTTLNYCIPCGTERNEDTRRQP